MATCRELAEDLPTVDRLLGLYWKLEKSATLLGLVLPWLPSKASRNKKQANADMYNILSSYIDSRRSAQEAGSDTIDLLIAQGDVNPAIVTVGLHLLFSVRLTPSISVHFYRRLWGYRQYRNDLSVSCKQSLG